MKIAELLVKQGVQVNARNEIGMTPIMYAIQQVLNDMQYYIV